MTAAQIQCLLAYLGYYKGCVDGRWGEQSRLATEKFQKAYGLEPDGIFGNATQKRIREVIGTEEAPAVEQDDIMGDASFWRDIRYWSKEEFQCRCGGKYCDGFPQEPDEKLVKLADRVRTYFGRPGYSSSGLRCKTWNEIQGGVRNSRHMEGKALDFRIAGSTAQQVLAFIQNLPGVRYAYDIDGTYVHMDVE